RREYRQRLTVLHEQIEVYESRAEDHRADAARAERDWLLVELASATGLRGRAREFGTSEERARVSVGKAIRRAIAYIEAADPVIGAELRDCVHTGMRCCYWPM
ncbi:MAG TPA: hypothetical protein VJT31_26430, partial [Rugosimonospora sp.]|nr:hypothetical protein [Rugosimonospora sp.]